MYLHWLVGLFVVGCLIVSLCGCSGIVQPPPKAYYGSATEPDCAPWHHKNNMAPVHCGGGDGGGGN